MLVEITTTPRLPPELILNVFEHCPKATLAASSLVSRQWRKMSISYLFKDIVLSCDAVEEDAPRGADNMDVDMDAMDQEHAGSMSCDAAQESVPKSLSTFREFLKNTPGVPQSVRALTIHLNPHEHIHALRYTDRETFFDVLRILPRLRALTLQDVFIPNWRSEVSVDIRLDRLTIGFPSSSGGGAGEIETIELLEMMTVFQSVKALRFEHFSFESSPDVIPFPPRLGVTSLELRRVWAISPFLESLRLGDALRGPNSDMLRELVVRDLERSDLLEMNWCLSSIGPNLHHLACCLPFEIRSQFDTVLNLEPCQNLRSLTLYLKMACVESWVPRPNAQAWEYCHRVLLGLSSAGTSPTLDLLTLSIGFQDMYAMRTARTTLMDVLHEIIEVEKLLVAFVERKMLRRVKAELTMSMTTGAKLPSTDIPVFFPRLQHMGVLSF